MPHWLENEPRLVLGHLALLSQQKGSALDRSYHPDVRRVIWTRTDMQKAIENQLEEGPGRFTSLEPEDSSDLLNYFLYPAGLLVEPAEDRIQFAHLSFQEYLCAEFLYEQGEIEGLQDYLQNNLFPQLSKPGWDEVGMLLLSVRAMKTRQQGHFQLLSWLNPTDVHQANLLVDALTGRELSFTCQERIAWLPVLLAAALIHPERIYGDNLARVPDFKDKGLELLTELFKADNDEKAWQVLVNALEDNKKHRIPNPQGHVLKTDMLQRWNNPSKDDSWEVRFTQSEARAHSLLRLLNQSGWVVPENKMNPIADTALQQIIAEWLEGRLQDSSDLLWSRNKDKLPITTSTSFELDRLLPQQGRLWKAVITHLPLDAWLLQGEAVSNNSWWYIFSQACVLLTLYPLVPLPKPMQLALQLYQGLIVGEAAAEGRRFANYSLSRELYRELAREMWKRVSRDRSKELLREMLRELSMERSLYILRDICREIWRNMSRNMRRDMFREVLWDMSRDMELSLREALKKIANYLDKHKPEKAILEPFAFSLEKFGYHYAAHDWFKEQAEKPDLMRSRGLRPGEPLPVDLGLFDEQGLLLATQRRENWLKFQAWLENDQAILNFTFPDGLQPDEKQELQKDLAQLWQQPWSPRAAIKAIIDDWPDTEPTRECNLAASEKMLLEACERFLEAVGEP
ncbi:MAG: hypothetical protein ABFS56_18430, partial [Pseudomonadota bacterium]